MFVVKRFYYADKSKKIHIDKKKKQNIKLIRGRGIKFDFIHDEM